MPNARSLARGPDGWIFVGTRTEGKVYAVRRRANDAATEVRVLLQGLTMPNGVAWRRGSLFVAEVSRLWRLDDPLSSPTPKPVLVTDRFPAEEAHGWKFIRFGPDGKLYVPIGAPCNVCDAGDPFSSLTRLNPDGSGFEIFARGVRNTVGFDWDPRTGRLWFTDNGRDWLGDDAPPDELNTAAESGLHFGFPFCHAGDIPDPDFGAKAPCSRFVKPAQTLSPHAAALGMRFYTGDQFPEDYRGDIFIAEHGSWNRGRKIGYRVMRVEIRNGRAGSSTPFAEGWLNNERAWGRPVDVEVLPDGSLLVSDDSAGAIYRIVYREKTSTGRSERGKP